MHAALIGVLLAIGSQPAVVGEESIVELHGTQPAVSHQVSVAYPEVTSYPTGSFPALHAYYCRGAFDYRRTFDFPWRPYRAVKTNRWVVPAAGATAGQRRGCLPPEAAV